MIQKQYTRPALSVITTTDPVARQLPALLEALSLLASQTSSHYEVVIVDDLAQWQPPNSVALPSYPNLHIRPLLPERSEGQQRALLKGVFIAKAPLILTIDPDLYPCTHDIPIMMGMINDHCWAVHGVRTQRADITSIRRQGSALANMVTSLITGLEVPDVGSPITLFSRRAINTLPLPSVKVVHARLYSYLMLGDRLAWHPLKCGSPANVGSQYSLPRLSLLFLRLVMESIIARRAIGKHLKLKS